MDPTAGRGCPTCSVGTGESVALAEFTLHRPGRILTVNVERAGNRWGRAEYVKQVRTEFGWMAKTLPRLVWFSVTVIPYQQRGRLQDTAACLPAVKAAVDGIVDAGVVPDDDGTHVRSIVFLPARRAHDGLTLVITGPEA